MKKFITSLLLFIPIAAIVYIALLLLWGDFIPHKIHSNLQYNKGYSDTDKRIAEAKKTKNPDVLFLGSSHSYREFDVRIFKKAGYNTFNLGSSSQAPMQTYVLMERYLKTIHPKMVVFEVYPGNFSPSNIEGATDLLSNDVIDTLSASMALNINNISVYNTLVYSWYDQRKEKLKTTYQPDTNKKNTYITGGYVELPISYYTNRPLNKRLKWKLDKQQLAAFEKTINIFKKDKIPYVLVFAPIPKSSYNARKNNEKFDAYMQKHGSYYNYNDKITLNDSLHFIDNNHLNQRGVEIFNNELLKNGQIFSHKKSGL